MKKQASSSVHGSWRLAAARFRRNRLAMAGVVLLGLMALAILLAPLYMSYSDMIHQDVFNKLRSPCAEHPLGTDELGRDLLARILYGGRISLFGGIATIAMFYAVARWNEYFKAGLYLLSPDKTTLQVLIRKFVVQGDITDLIGFSNMMNKTELANVNYNSLKSAAIVVGVAPILLIYPFALKFYAKDVMEGGVKE